LEFEVEASNISVLDELETFGRLSYKKPYPLGRLLGVNSQRPHGAFKKAAAGIPIDIQQCAVGIVARDRYIKIQSEAFPPPRCISGQIDT
jgi:hypothetical protein